MNKLQFKLCLGALTGSLVIGGATYGVLNKQTGRTTIPFYREIIKEYQVNQQLVTIDYNNSGEITIEKSNNSDYLLKSELKDFNTIEINVHSPYFTNDKEQIYIKHYKYIFKEIYTKEEIENKIKLLKSRDFAKLLEDCSSYSSYVENPIILPEDNNLKVEMLIQSIDYNNIKSTKQSLDDDFYETIILTFATILGGGMGSLVQENFKLEQEILKMDKETIPKKKVKKK